MDIQLQNHEGHYRIEVEGQLPPGWSDRIGAMQISLPSTEADRAATVLEGPVSDQTELAGILQYAVTKVVD